jgi:hypothetical protein
VAEPQLRCLLCDLILADESTAGQSTEKCLQAGCGRMILSGQTPAEPASDVLELRPINRATPVDLEPLPRTSTSSTKPSRTSLDDDDLPIASVVPKSGPIRADLPTVQPRPRIAPRPSSLPTAKPRQPTSLPELSRSTSAGRPQILTALSVLGCMTLLIVFCLGVIAFSLLYGLNKARKAELPRLNPAPLSSVVCGPG